MTHLLVILAVIIFIFSDPSSNAIAATEKRVALVIGNGKYQNAPVLANPSNDAKEIAASLGRLGFDVDLEVDLDRAALAAALRRFGDHLEGATSGVLYYAGHGLQVNGINYLVPIDAKLAKERDLDWEVIDAASALRMMEGTSRVNLVFLDACRDNPLAQNLIRSMGSSRSMVGRGLSRIDASTGTLISFATKDGNVAEDGIGAHSPYTTALLNHLEDTNVDVAIMLRRVREEVIKSTREKQVPWEYGSLTGEFYLNRHASLGLAPSNAPPTVDKDTVFWQSIQGSSNAGDFISYVKQFPTGTFIDLAHRRIEELGKSQTETRPSNLTDTQNDDRIMKETALWNEIKDSNDWIMYNDFLSKYKNSAFSGLVRRKKEEMINAVPWQAAAMMWVGLYPSDHINADKIDSNERIGIHAESSSKKWLVKHTLFSVPSFRAFLDKAIGNDNVNRIISYRSESLITRAEHNINISGCKPHQCGGGDDYYIGIYTYRDFSTYSICVSHSLNSGIHRYEIYNSDGLRKKVESEKSDTCKKMLQAVAP